MIKIFIHPADRAKIQDMFSGMKTIGEKVLSRSLNKTLTGVRTDASTEIRKVLNAKQAAVNETFSLNKATTKKMTASIVSTGKPLGLIDFVGTTQKLKGVSVLVTKGGKRKIIPGTFIATMKSGHKGVFWREWHGARKAKSPKIRYGALRGEKGNKYRLKIKERFAPRVPDYLGDKGPIMQRILTKAGVRLHNNLEHELSYELSKLK